MTYEFQRQVLEYIRRNFSFKKGDLYFFDVGRCDVKNNFLVYKKYRSESKFYKKVNKNLYPLKTHIVVCKDFDGDLKLMFNSDDFTFIENLEKKYVETDDYYEPRFDPIYMKLEMLKLARELSSQSTSG